MRTCPRCKRVLFSSQKLCPYCKVKTRPFSIKCGAFQDEDMW